MTETPDYVICLKCFEHNPPGEDFCWNCGAYLPFEGVPGEENSAAPAEHKEALAADAPSREESAREVPTHEQTAAEEPARDLDTRSPSPPGPPTGGLPAEAALPAGPALRKPAASAAPRTRAPAVPTPAEPAPAPDDVICPVCHTPNRPERRFCRRCGTRLAESSLAAASAQPAAGTRPKGRSTRFPFTAVLVLLVLIGLLVVAWLNRDPVIGFVETIVGFVFSSQSP